MPQGDKSSYTDKQKRQAGYIEAGYEKMGLKMKTAKARAWATVNKLTGGGKKSGSGRKKNSNYASLNRQTSQSSLKSRPALVETRSNNCSDLQV